MNGPVTGPLIGGFAAQYLGWRWTNWLVMIFSGVALLCMICIKETYAPAILRKKAAKMRKEMDDERYWSRYDEKRSFIPMLKVNLSRPFVLTATEPILWFWDLYIGVSYATFVGALVILSTNTSLTGHLRNFISVLRGISVDFRRPSWVVSRFYRPSFHRNRNWDDDCHC